MNANQTQVGGDHYSKFEPQIWDIIAAWNLGYFDGQAIAYIARAKYKNGVEDLKKAQHMISKMIELIESSQAETARQAAEKAQMDIAEVAANFSAEPPEPDIEALKQQVAAASKSRPPVAGPKGRLP